MCACAWARVGVIPRCTHELRKKKEFVGGLSCTVDPIRTRKECQGTEEPPHIEIVNSSAIKSEAYRKRDVLPFARNKVWRTTNILQATLQALQMSRRPLSRASLCFRSYLSAPDVSPVTKAVCGRIASKQKTGSAAARSISARIS